MAVFPRFFKLVLNLKEGKTNDVLGAYPVKVHVPAMPERRYLHTTRIMTIASVISISVSIFLASILYLLPAQVSMSPQFMVLDRFNNKIAPIERFTSSVEAMDFVFEKLIADYVRMRNTVPNNLEKALAAMRPDSMLRIMTEGNANFSLQNDMDSLIQDVRKNGLERNVKILWVKKIRAGVWRVRYNTYDTYKGKEEQNVKSWYAVIDAGVGHLSDEQNIKMMNPFGFYVKNYVVSTLPNNSDDLERFVFEE